jgi:type I restriction enzyme M protein
MMVKLMKPTANDKIVDPAAGTSGFLVSSAEYVYKNHYDEIFNSNDQKYKTWRNWRKSFLLKDNREAY